MVPLSLYYNKPPKTPTFTIKARIITIIIITRTSIVIIIIMIMIIILTFMQTSEEILEPESPWAQELDRGFPRDHGPDLLATRPKCRGVGV